MIRVDEEHDCSSPKQKPWEALFDFEAVSELSPHFSSESPSWLCQAHKQGAETETARI